MKVAFINSVAGFGSTGRIVYQLSKIDGVEGKIYYGRKKDLTKDGNTKRITGLLGNIHHVLQTYMFDKHGFCNAQETRKLVQDIKEFDPDIIHLHNLHGYYIDVEVLFHFLKEYNKPVIWTLHDCWSFTGHCAYYDLIGCNKWKTQCENCPQINTYPASFNKNHVLDNFLKKKALFNSLNNLTLVTPSKWLKEEVEESFLKDIDIQVIHNGVDLTQFVRIKSSFREDYNLQDKFVILAVASVWNKTKGIDDLKKFAEILPDKFQLVIVGNDIKGNPIKAGKAISINRTNSIKELCEIYSSADVFANFTHEDNFPTVNIEALACGCPVVTYNTGGSPEIIDRDTGIVIKKGNIDQMIDTFIQLSNDYPFDHDTCIEHAKQYSLDNMYKAYYDLYVSKVNEYDK